MNATKKTIKKKYNLMAFKFPISTVDVTETVKDLFPEYKEKDATFSLAEFNNYYTLVRIENGEATEWKILKTFENENLSQEDLIKCFIENF